MNPRPTNDARDPGDGVLLVDDGLPPWHNAANPYDVNWDGQVTPLDALVLINCLNVAADEGGPAADAMLRALSGDVNDDTFCTADDVLAVINHLNAAPFPAAEGESSGLAPTPRAGVRPPVPATKEPPTEGPADRFYRGLATELAPLETILEDLAADIAAA